MSKTYCFLPDPSFVFILEFGIPLELLLSLCVVLYVTQFNSLHDIHCTYRSPLSPHFISALTSLWLRIIWPSKLFLQDTCREVCSFQLIFCMSAGRYWYLQASQKFVNSLTARLTTCYSQHANVTYTIIMVNFLCCKWRFYCLVHWHCWRAN